MKRFWISALIIAVLVLITFLLAEQLEIRILVDPSEWMQRNQIYAIVIGGGLLVADVFLPVPSSIVMMTLGAVLGIAGGFCVSFSSSVMGSLVGWYLGRNCEKWVMRNVSDGERRKASLLFERFGITAIVISRMLPILSETMSIMSGVSGMSWRRMLVASAMGSIPPALIYAIAGAAASDFAAGSMIAAIVFVIAGVSWWISRKLGESSRAVDDESATD